MIFHAWRRFLDFFTKLFVSTRKWAHGRVFSACETSSLAPHGPMVILPAKTL
jgi:hypothetical protein